MKRLWLLAASACVVASCDVILRDSETCGADVLAMSEGMSRALR